MAGNELKATLLDEPFGTANAKLKKALLFNMAGRLGMLNCYRCNNRIEDLNRFSIEHKRAWMKADNPKESFFDIDNIAFSHLSCNIGMASRGRRIYSSPLEKSRAKDKKEYSDPIRYAKHLQEKRKNK